MEYVIILSDMVFSAVSSSSSSSSSSSLSSSSPQAGDGVAVEVAGYWTEMTGKDTCHIVSQGIL